MKVPMLGIDASHVGQVVQDFIDFDNISELNVEKQADGTFTVTPVG